MMDDNDETWYAKRVSFFWMYSYDIFRNGELINSSPTHDQVINDIRFKDPTPSSWPMICYRRQDRRRWPLPALTTRQYDHLLLTVGESGISTLIDSVNRPCNPRVDSRRLVSRVGFMAFLNGFITCYQYDNDDHHRLANAYIHKILAYSIHNSGIKETDGIIRVLNTDAIITLISVNWFRLKYIQFMIPWSGNQRDVIEYDTTTEALLAVCSRYDATTIMGCTNALSKLDWDESFRTDENFAKMVQSRLYNQYLEFIMTTDPKYIGILNTIILGSLAGLHGRDSISGRVGKGLIDQRYYDHQVLAELARIPSSVLAENSIMGDYLA